MDRRTDGQTGGRRPDSVIGLFAFAWMDYVTVVTGFVFQTSKILNEILRCAIDSGRCSGNCSYGMQCMSTLDDNLICCIPL